MRKILDKKAIVMRELGLWIIGILLLLLILGFLADLPFLRWINFLPDYEYSDKDDVFIGDVPLDEVRESEDQCFAIIGEEPAAIDKIKDNRVILINDQKTSYFFKGEKDGEIIFEPVKSYNFEIGVVESKVISINSALFNQNSKESWKIWEGYLFRKSIFVRNYFISFISNLHNSDINGLLEICHEKATWVAPEIIERWPDNIGSVEKIELSKMATGSEGDVKTIYLAPHLNYKALNLGIDNLLLEDEQGGTYWSIWGSKKGWDVQIGLLFRDGSIWIKSEYFKKMAGNSEVFSNPDLSLQKGYWVWEDEISIKYPLEKDEDFFLQTNLEMVDIMDKGFWATS